MVTPWGNKLVAWRKRQCKEQCQVHEGEEGHARPGWTTSRRGQDSPWKSQSEWQRTEMNGESTSMVWPTLGSRTAKEQNRDGNNSSQLPLSHWVQSVRRVAFSFLNSVASLLINRATPEKSALYFSDSPFWFSGTMPSCCMTVLWRRRRSKVFSSLIFVLFSIA